MFDIFDFFNTDVLAMMGTYEQRKVDNFKCDEFVVDTSEVYDRSQPYETAVLYEGFNRNEWIILEFSDTREEAQKVHNKWVEYFKNNNVTEIKDVYSGIIFIKG